MPQEVLTIRLATADDAPLISSLFQLAYGDSSHPCKDVGHVRNSIRSGTSRWRIAVDDGQVVACVTSILSPWNRSCELARGVTLKEYRGGGLGTELLQRSLHEACNSPGCEVLLGVPRNRTMQHILSNQLAPCLLPVGHDGAINVANGVREYHAISFAVNPAAEFDHYIPESPALSHCEFVRQNIFRPLGLRPQKGKYPPRCIIGDGYDVPDSEFSFEHDPFCPSQSVEITGSNSEPADPRQTAKNLISFLRTFEHILHVRVTVLVDKAEFIAQLVDVGFEITAYLPAWHWQEGGRYDCVLLVRRSFTDEPIDHGVRQTIEIFRDGLNRAAGPRS